MQSRGCLVFGGMAGEMNFGSARTCRHKAYNTELAGEIKVALVVPGRVSMECHLQKIEAAHQA